MISISGKHWTERIVNTNSINKIKQDFNFNEILSRLIVSRNFDYSEIININNNLKVTNVFKKNLDFIAASEILLDSIKKKENICIIGDYDVDGASSTSLMARYFNHIKQPYFYYIPDREKDGYGASKKLFQKLILKDPKLVIMLDCGSTSNNAIEFLNENNIKSIIIDHHEINKPYPKSNAIINPKLNNGYIGYDYFCATALTYFFIDILIQKTNSKFKLSNFLIFVLLATVCDVMPLRKINKLIAINVLNNFKIKNIFAFDFIFKQLDIKKKLSINDLGYLIGPIINSGGRLGFSTYGAELLISDNTKIIERRANELIKLNNERKEFEQNVLNEINFEKINNENKNVIIYYNKNIKEGLIGIIAARLKDYFNKPSIVITNSNDILKGSARSTSNYNIGHLVKLLLDEKIIENGGGHNMAAGFTLKKEKITILDNFIQHDYSRKITKHKMIYNFDSELSASAINNNFIDEIEKLGPFGNNNFIPIFYIKNIKIIKSTVINSKHISSIVKPNIGKSIKSICFNSVDTQLGNYLLSYKKKINIITELNENIWNNKKTVQLNIKDLIL